MGNNYFNRMKFNVPDETTETEKQIEIFSVPSQQINGVWLVTVPVQLHTKIDQKMSGSLSTNLAKSFSAFGSNSIKGENKRMLNAIQTSSSFSQGLNASVKYQNKIQFKLNAENNLKAKVKPTAKINFITQFTNGINAETDLGKRINSVVSATNLINGYVSAVVTQTESISLDVTIPPNGELVINSHNFTVLINNENAIDAHNEGWLMMDRGVMSAGVLFGVSNDGAECTLEYLERWL